MIKIAAIVLTGAMAAGCTVHIRSETYYGVMPQRAPMHYYALYGHSNGVSSLCNRLSPASRAEVYQCR